MTHTITSPTLLTWKIFFEEKSNQRFDCYIHLLIQFEFCIEIHIRFLLEFRRIFTARIFLAIFFSILFLAVLWLVIVISAVKLCVSKDQVNNCLHCNKYFHCFHCLMHWLIWGSHLISEFVAQDNCKDNCKHYC